MMWLRRGIAIPLIIIFFLLLVVLLVAVQLDNTVANPQFYNDRLLEADVYSWVYDEVLPVGLDELEGGPASEKHLDTSRIQDDVVEAARKILPPEWLQEKVESVFDAVVPYMAGDINGFTLYMELRERFDVAVAVIIEDILLGNVFYEIRDAMLSYLAEELHKNLDRLPYVIEISEAEIESALRDVLPADWVAHEAESAIDSVAPYLTSETDHFTITVHVRDLVDPAAAAATELLATPETYDFLVEELIEPVVEDSVGDVVELPYGVSLSLEEVMAAIKEALPPDWMRARLTDMIEGIAAYLKGDAETIEIVIDLRDRLPVALDALAVLADGKLETLYYSLPECSMWQFLQESQGLPVDTPPSCRPAGMSYEEARAALGIDIQAEIDRAIGDLLPEEWTYTEADLRQLLSDLDAEDFLDDVREWVAEGWTFTDADLRELLDSDGRDTLEEVRSWIRYGRTATEADLRATIEENGIDLETHDSTRRNINTARTWLWPAGLLPFLFLFFVGLLVARNWSGRLAWAMVLLFVVSLLIYVAAGAVYSTVGRPSLTAALEDPADYEVVETLIVDKRNEIVVDAVDTYVSGLRNKTLLLVIGSGTALAGVILWRRRRAYDDTQEPTDANC